jgi:hypothetical protein
MKAGFGRASLRSAGLIISIFSKPNEGSVSEASLCWAGLVIWIFSKRNEGRFWVDLTLLGWIHDFDFF